MDERKLPIAIPRNYGLVVERGGTDLFIPPANFAIGNVIRTSRKELDRKLIAWQQDRRQAYQSFKEGKETFRRLFLEEKGNEELVLELISVRPEVLRTYLADAIKKEERSKNLWRVGGSDAIKEGYLGKRVLSGQIKSKDDARRKNTLRMWGTMVRDGLGGLGFLDSPEYRDVYCQCHDHYWSRQKSVAVVCVHTASLLEYLYCSPEIIENAGGRESFWMPFNFVTDDAAKTPEGVKLSYIEEEGRLPRSVLEMDVVISHYLFGEKYFEINKKLIKLFQIFGPGIIDGVRDGRYCFGAIRQKEKNVKEPDNYTGELIELEKRLSNMLISDGFRPSKVYAVEFRDGPYETLATDYTRDDLSVRLLYNENFPPLLVERRNGQPSNVVEIEQNPTHPFTQLFEDQESIDDKTRRRTYFRIRIPRVKLPGVLKEAYRSNIERYYKGDRGKVLEEFGL